MFSVFSCSYTAMPWFFLLFREAYFFMGAVMLLGCPVVLMSPLAEKRSSQSGGSSSEKDSETQKIVKN